MFLIFKVQLSKLKRPRKKDTIKKQYKPYMAKSSANLRGQKKRYYKKAIQTLYGQKDHLPWKKKVLKSPIVLTGINKVPIVG